MRSCRVTKFAPDGGTRVLATTNCGEAGLRRLSTPRDSAIARSVAKPAAGSYAEFARGGKWVMAVAPVRNHPGDSTRTASMVCRKGAARGRS